MSDAIAIIFGLIGLICIAIGVGIYIFKKATNYKIQKNAEDRARYDSHKRAEKKIDDIAEEVKNFQEQD